MTRRSPRSLAFVMGTYGHQVRLASGLTEAASVLSGWPVDVVLTDLMFPLGRVSDLIRTIQKTPLGPAVVVLTGVSDIKVHDQLLELGVCKVLVKGTGSLRVLVSVIESAARQVRLAP